MKNEKGKEVVRTHHAKAPLSSLCRPPLKNPCSTIEGVCFLGNDSYFCYNADKQNKTNKKPRPVPFKFTKSHKPHRFLFAPIL